MPRKKILMPFRLADIQPGDKVLEIYGPHNFYAEIDYDDVLEKDAKRILRLSRAVVAYLNNNSETLLGDKPS